MEDEKKTVTVERLNGYYGKSIISSAVIENNMFYYQDVGTALIQFDMDLGNAKIIDNSNGVDGLDTFFPLFLRACGKSIFLFEYIGKRIYKYDMMKNSYYLYEPEIELNNNSVRGTYINATSIYGKIYAYPRCGNITLCIDENEIKCIKDNVFLKLADDYKVICFEDENICVADRSKTFVGIIKNNGEIDWTHCYDDMGGKSISLFKNEVYELSESGEVYRIETNINKKEKILDVSGLGIGKIYVKGNLIWYLPEYGNDIYKSDINGELFSKYEDYPNDFKIIQNVDWLKIGSKYDDCSVCSGIAYFGMKASNYLLSINDKGIAKWIRIPEIKNLGVRSMVLYNRIIIEGRIKLTEFIDFLDGQ